METNPEVLTFEKVSFAYDPHLPMVMKDVSFSLPKGSFTVIVGPSGSGKSTLLRLTIGLDAPTEGTVSLHAKTRMIFQSGALLPWHTALQNVCLGLAGTKRTQKQKEIRARAALADLGIEAFAKAYPRDLSGGQRQRVGIARALVTDPELLLLDEPFSALDVETTEHLAEEILSIHEKKGVAMLMVSHSIDDAVMLADRILVFSGGQIRHEVPVTIAHPRKRDDPGVEALIKEVKKMMPSLS